MRAQTIGKPCYGNLQSLKFNQLSNSKPESLQIAVMDWPGFNGRTSASSLKSSSMWLNPNESISIRTCPPDSILLMVSNCTLSQIPLYRLLARVSFVSYSSQTVRALTRGGGVGLSSGLSDALSPLPSPPPTTATITAITTTIATNTPQPMPTFLSKVEPPCLHRIRVTCDSYPRSMGG